MSITPFLHREFDPETVAVMSRTLDSVCAELGLTLQDPAAEVVAIKIVELAESGIRTPRSLYLRTLAAFKLIGSVFPGEVIEPSPEEDDL